MIGQIRVRVCMFVSNYAYVFSLRRYVNLSPIVVNLVLLEFSSLRTSIQHINR